MDIKTYDLIIDVETKHTALQVKDSFAYAVDSFREPKAIYALMTEVFHMNTKADEYVYMGAFNNRMKLLGMFEISHGLGDSSLIDARGVYMRALQIGASNIVVIHNHPSGIPLPSRDDFRVCRRIREAGEMCDGFCEVIAGRFCGFCQEIFGVEICKLRYKQGY